MNKNKTELVIVLDRSGSMESIKTDMQGGLETFINKQKTEPGECFVSCYQFDTLYETVCEGKNIKDVGAISIVPRGGTALLDAVGKTINAVGKRLSDTPENDRPGLVVFMIITDGEENSSREFKRETIASMVKEQTEKYSWQFVFLGANQDAFTVGQTMGFAAANSTSYACSSAGIGNVISATSIKMSKSRGDVSRGLVADFSYTAQEREAAMEDDTAKAKKKTVSK